MKSAPLLLAFVSCVVSSTLNVSLSTSWKNPPFSVQLIEAAASHNESLYLPAVHALYSQEGPVKEDDLENEIDLFDDDVEPASDETVALSDQQLYKRVTELLPESADFVSLNLLNKIFVPRIHAHYNHYESENLAKLAEKQCRKDSFGNSIEDPSQAWVKYGDQYYCSEADLFALQLSSDPENALPFDRVIGSNEKKPLLVLYASPSSPRFAAMFETLNGFAKSGKLRFVWRYAPDPDAKTLSLPGFGATLSPRNAINGSKSSIKYKGDLELYLNEISLKSEPIQALHPNDSYALSLKINALISEEPEEKKLPLLEKIVNNLPLYAPYIDKIPAPASFEETKAIAEKNSNTGASTDSVGLYVNGSPIPRLELDVPHLIEKLQNELRFVQKLQDLGFSASQARLLFTKYALLSAFKEVQFQEGQNENRYNIYKDTFKIDTPESGGVIYFNDIENDDSYALYETDRASVYNGPQARRLQFGQIPPLKENVHDLIFVLNFSSKSQLRVFFTFSKVVLDTNIPQQVGILPLVDNDEDAVLVEKFYHILEVGSKQEALAFLYQLLEADCEELKQELLDKIKVPAEKQGTYKNNKKTLDQFSIGEPSIVINGVIHSLRTPWQSPLRQQVGRDVRTLQKIIQDRLDYRKPLKYFIYQNALDERNLRIIPQSLANIRYKEIFPEMLDISYSFSKDTLPLDMPNTIWLIGEFSSRLVLQQFLEILDFISEYKERLIQVRVLDTSKDDSAVKKLHKSYAKLTDTSIEQLKKAVGKVKAKQYIKLDDEKLDVLLRSQFQVHQPSLLFNSRYLRLNEIYTSKELSQLAEFEQNQKQSIFKAITDTFPDDFNWQGIMYFKDKRHSTFDWFDLVMSTVTKSFLLEDSISRTDVDRYDFKSLDFSQAITAGANDAPLEVLAIVDPLNELSQRLVSILKSVSGLLLVKTQVLILPLQDSPRTGLDRFYASAFVDSRPQFDENGKIVESSQAVFDSVPSDAVSVADLDVPTRWHYLKGKSEHDLDNLEVKENDSISFELSKLVVEGFVKDVATGRPISGLTMDFKKNQEKSEGIAVQALGYIQWRVTPGLWEVSLQEGSSSAKQYELYSANENKYDRNDQPLLGAPVEVFSLHGKTVHPRLREKTNKSGKITSIDKVDIKVFSIASGKLYERFLATMMMSVKDHTKHSVKFWLVENFLSAEFREELPKLAEKLGFQYELIAYKWPVWLRQQRERHRQVWAYKILFLDVLFPHKLDKVIFVDADQVARTDLQELVDVDLEGAPYGFPPMGESREEVEGFRFWKQGYWKNVLRDDLRYHISALYVVDLQELRSIYGGDRLRAHYQKLSSDPNSLANLDQDLPNNMQRSIPIHTLLEDWLWCETWCSDESKSRAKMIDLCSDPFRKESKLERAKRLIPEWTAYNQRLTSLARGPVPHDEL